MPLDNLALAALTDDTEACIDRLRVDGAAPDSSLLQQLEETYACLLELQAFRDLYPNTRITPVYATAYGYLGMQ